jgi:hypothetical protein
MLGKRARELIESVRGNSDAQTRRDAAHLGDRQIFLTDVHGAGSSQ